MYNEIGKRANWRPRERPRQVVVDDLASFIEDGIQIDIRQGI